MATWRRHPKISEIPTELNIRRLWECEQLVTIMISPGVGYFSIVPIRTWRQVGVQQRGLSFRNWNDLVVLECVTCSCKTEIGSKWRKWSSRFFKEGQDLERKTLNSTNKYDCLLWFSWEHHRFQMLLAKIMPERYPKWTCICKVDNFIFLTFFFEINMLDVNAKWSWCYYFHDTNICCIVSA